MDQKNENLQKSSSNLRFFKYVNPESITVYDLLKFKHLIITEPAILDLEKRLQLAFGYGFFSFKDHHIY